MVLLRALATACLLALAALLLTASALTLLAPDPALARAGRQLDAQSLAELRSQLGSDAPLAQRLQARLVAVAGGDLGRSLVNGEPIAQRLWTGLWRSLLLCLPGVVIGHGLALGLALAVAGRPWLAAAAQISAAAALAAGVLLAGLVLQAIFAVGLGWFPTRGIDQTSLIGLIHGSALPTLTLAVLVYGWQYPVYRAAVSIHAGSPWLEAMAARGHGRCLRGYATVRALAALTCTRVAYSALALWLGGTVVLERLYGVDALGSRLLAALAAQDWPMVEATVMTAAAMTAFTASLLRAVDQTLDGRAGGGS